jgi:nucleotide-binding universal stress UspA family protein
VQCAERSAHCTRTEEDSLQKPVVAGVDGSPQSIAAARFAAREALRCGLPLRLVHAWRSLPVVPGVGMLESDVPEILAQARQEIEARHPELTVETVQIPHGEPDGLVAASKDAELLVPGVRVS